MDSPDYFNLMSIIGLTIQCSGIMLIAILSFFMTRSIRSTALDYWTLAWSCLALSLIFLAVGFRVKEIERPFYSIYLFGEYIFGYLFIAGCRSYSSGSQLLRRDLFSLIPGAVAAIGLPHISKDFNVIFIPQALIMAGFFCVGFYSLGPARQRGLSSPGLRVMSVALVLLAIDFLHYVPVIGYSRIIGKASLSYLRYTSIYDLILEILLGFGTVMIVMDDVRHKVELTNRELRNARDRLEVLAKLDPMTEALNRHAFYALLEHEIIPTQSVSGCVVVIDIDNLKPINDSFGHASGDAVIREVARSVRSVIRADDLLYRWGGDEFLILMFGISHDEATKRTAEIDSKLALTQVPHASGSVPVIVSYGMAAFTSLSHIEKAIDEADSAMYASKQARKAAQKKSLAGSPPR